MANYPRSAYGGSDPNATNYNGDNGWGPYKWPGGVPSNLLGTAQFQSRSGQLLRWLGRRELVELMTLFFALADKHGYVIWANKGGVVWGPWAYANRAIAGTSSASNHSRGRAIDVNAPNNPYVETARFTCDMPPGLVRDWEAIGMHWGGRYSGRQDTMHFEYAWTPGHVAGHVAKAKQLLGGAAPVQPPTTTAPPPEEDDLPYTKDQLIAIVHQAVNQALADRNVGLKSTVNGAGGSVLDFLTWTNADAWRAMTAAESINSDVDVWIYADDTAGGVGLFRYDVLAGESSHIPDPATLEATIAVLQQSGKNVKFWPGGDVRRGGAAGRRDTDAKIPGQQPEKETRHKVVSGDTVGALAAKYGCSVQQIVDWNKLASPDAIEVDQDLIVGKA